MYLRASKKMVEVLDPVDGSVILRKYTTRIGQRSYLDISLEANQSVFVVLSDKIAQQITPGYDNAIRMSNVNEITSWKISFDTSYGGPAVPIVYEKNQELKSWTAYDDPSIKYYSGTAVYSSTFNLNEKEAGRKVQLYFTDIFSIATVKVNGMDCGTLWTPPFLLDISKALKPGENKIVIEVSNTWHNRLIGDNLPGTVKKITWTTAPFRLKDKPLLPAGLTGRIFVEIE